MSIRSLIPAALLCTANAALTRRFTSGANPTGTVDPGTIDDCTYWINAVSSDTCPAIEDYWGLSEAQLTYYNPALKSDCSGLTAGHSYCVEVNGGEDPEPPTTSAPSTSSTVSSATTATSSGPQPEQTGITSDCTNYYQVQAGDGCEAIVDMYGTFSLADFYNWNPAVGNNCQGLKSGYYVCVGVPGTPTSKPTPTSAASSGPSPEQTGIVSGCKNYYLVQPGDGCQAIVDTYAPDFTLQQFYGWNPAVGNTCQHLEAGYYVCVGVAGTPTATATKPSSSGPLPEQTGIVSGCKAYYKAQSGDSCYSIADMYGTFTTAQFESWNPAVGSNCGGLDAGYYYCVGVAGTPTTRPTSSASPTPTGKGPQPQEPDTIASCKTYYLVQSGDSCYDIEQANRITAAQFNAWNPYVGSDCAKLYAGDYICVEA